MPLRVSVPPPLSAVPSTLILRKDGDDRFQPVEWILINNDPASQLGQVTPVNAPPEIQIEELERIDDRRRRYRLTIKDGWKPNGRWRLKLEDSATTRRCELALVSSN